jgi:thioredoxin 1
LATADFDDVVGSGYTIIDCYTDWCGPCKVISSTYAELAVANAGAPVKFVKYDAASDPKRSSKLNIKALPTFLAMKDGVEVGRMTGAKKTELAQFVAQHAAAAAAGVPASVAA